MIDIQKADKARLTGEILMNDLLYQFIKKTKGCPEEYILKSDRADLQTIIYEWIEYTSQNSTIEEFRALRALSQYFRKYKGNLVNTISFVEHNNSFFTFGIDTLLIQNITKERPKTVPNSQTLYIKIERHLMDDFSQKLIRQNLNMNILKINQPLIR